MSHRPKIIHIARRHYGLWDKLKDEEEYSIDLDNKNFVVGGWSYPMALNTLKFTDDYDLECWRMDRAISERAIRKYDGITFRLLPYSNDLIPLNFLKEIIEESKKNKIILHFHAPYSRQNQFLLLFLKNIPVILQHRGSFSSRVKSRHNKKLKYFLDYEYEKLTYNNVDYFLTCSQYWKSFISKIVGKDKISMHFGGKDFETFRPHKKIDLRKSLGLPKNKKILIFVGHFMISDGDLVIEGISKLKGLDSIIRVHNKLRKKYNLELVIVGGHPRSQFSQGPIIKSGMRIFGHLEQNKVAEYVSASDVYIYLPWGHERYWAGMGSAPVEALACGVPLVSTGLANFPSSEWRKVGEIPINENEVESCISKILDNPKNYDKCRQIAFKYFAWENSAPRLIKIYDSLFKKYYNGK